MFYVYILQSLKDKNLYIGRTNNLARRIKEHNSGKVASTKSRRPFVMVENIEVPTEQESVILEKEYKKRYRREEIRKKYNLGGFA
ncbi:MAG: GIY-YIG nuclease family protein [Candidatus Sungbacteria bacterium]|nr:GIY-YIG nuclease family protein [Candidatus Sungbacteria bacterium]